MAVAATAAGHEGRRAGGTDCARASAACRCRRRARKRTRGRYSPALAGSPGRPGAKTMSILKKFFSGARGMRRGLSIFGPYVGAGVRVRELSEDFRHLRVEMKLHWYNTNYVGTHFGGSLYSMIDPFWMLLLMNNLGRDYIVWDKAAHIDFIKPGTGTVSATFTLTDDMLEEVRSATANGDK